MNHERIEKHIGLMAVLVAVVISFGGLVEIVPLMLQRAQADVPEAVQPLRPLEVAGREIYLREGCFNCHSQMVRSLAEEVLRYGPASVAAESAYDHPFQWGSKRTGPDLARVGGRYSDDWHRLHLLDPRALVPESNMPGYPWLDNTFLDHPKVARMMRALRATGVPYTEEDVRRAPAAVKGYTEMDALVAYLQSLRAMPRRTEVAQK